MRFSPTLEENQQLLGLDATERFQYALPRLCECEEVWGLGDSSGWLIRDVDDRALISIWPYRSMALECASGEFEDSNPICVSLEHFLYTLLGQCRDNEIDLEVCPAPGQVGHRIAADALYELLEGMVEAESYFVEG